MILRDYQLEAITSIEHEFSLGRRSTLLVLPTGTGKTVVFSELARRYAESGRRTLILAHRDELIEQAVEKASRLIDPTRIGIEKASKHASCSAMVVIGSVQTLRQKRLESWPADHFSLIVCDEAHHAAAESYKRVFDHFTKAKHLGVTATPHRGDDQKLSDIFESRAFELGLWEAVDRGFLSQLELLIADVRVDLRGIRIKAGDFDSEQLNGAITANMEALVNSITRHCQGRKTIIFVPTRACAQLMAQRLADAGMKADYVTYKCTTRAEKIARYQRGELQVLVNPTLLTEGFDDPSTDCIVLCRPTRSRVALMQQIGRGVRLHRGKENCLVIDFAWQTGRRDIACLLEDQPIAAGQPALPLNRPHNLAQLRERARVEAIRQAELQRQREVKLRRAELRFADGTIDLRLIGLTATDEMLTGRPATPRQIAAVQNWLKLPFTPENLTMNAAGAILDRLGVRLRGSMATYRQLILIRRVRPNLEPEKLARLTFNEASAILERALKQRPASVAR
jgi:superfamily II DNA or RNA helicase